MNTFLDRIIRSYKDTIVKKQDLLGGGEPSALFYILAPICRRLLDYRSEKLIAKGSMRLRKMIHPILMMLSPIFLEYKQVIEEKPDIPQGPVIWIGNHGFKDDIMASIKAAGRHVYFMFGSLPMCMNTLDGLGAYLNGIVLCNRKIKESKAVAYKSWKKVLELGSDLLIFPEGVWNKTPNKLILDLWPGAIRLAQETRHPIVPIVHYLADPHKQYEGNVIHTVIGDPIHVDGLSETDGIRLVRDTMATMYYQLMEKYGKSSREELLEGYETADEAWNAYLKQHTEYVKYYDKEIERAADYRPKSALLPQDVWKPISDIRKPTTMNIRYILEAQRIVQLRMRTDFQRKY